MKEWLPAGTVIAHFRVSSRISANGAGEVYQATEASSGAELALKLLPSALVEDLQARQRFIQTFASVAQLRHHNFCLVHGAGVSEEGRPFVAMEYLQGQSLDLVSLNHRLSIPEIISIIAQVAEALDALHERGWLHLGIKPADLMLTSDGQVKILDFGLGLAFPLSLAGDGAGKLKVTPSSARYLSPEQAMGEPTDRRSDVFSLGAVFYELLAGRPAFAGSSVNEALAAVALATPPPVTDFREDASPALNAIVMKALAKDAAARYQTMGELARDLRNLPEAENILAQGREARTIIPRGDGREGSEGERLPPDSIIEDLKQALSRLFESKPQRQKSLLAKTGLEEDRSLLGDIAQFWKLYKRYLLAGLLALVGIAIAVVIAGTLRDRLAGTEERQAMSVTHATTNGKVTNAAISPDGELLVYAVDEAAGQSLWLKELKSAKETRLAQAQPVEYSGLTFSPDGASIAYLKTPFDSGSGAVFRIAARGGTERPLPVTGALSSVSFSPDGKRLAVIRTTDDGSETSLWVGDETGAGEALSVRRGLAAFQPASPAWSPDGRVIVCAARDADSDLFLRLVAIGVADKTESVIVSGRWSEIDGMAWLADGRGLIVSASDPVTRRSQLWQVEYSANGAGEVSRVTRDLSDYRGVSLTRDSSLLVSAQSETLSNIWVAPNTNAGQLRQVTTGRQDGVNGIVWTPDGRLIYVSLTGDRESLWMSDRRVEENNEESRHLPLPTESGDGGQYQPAVSPDGRFAVYVIERAGGAFLLRNEIERREFKPLTEDRLAFFPQFSPDGKWVIYSTNRGGRAVIARVSSDGGTPETLIAGRAWRAVVSPDGANLACNYLDETTARWRLAVMPISGGAPAAIFDASGSLHRVVQWTPDGAGLAFIVTRGGVSNIWIQQLSGGSTAQLTSFKTGRIFNFAWSRDGKQLALAHGWVSSDVALIRNFR